MQLYERSSAGIKSLCGGSELKYYKVKANMLSLFDAYKMLFNNAFPLIKLFDTNNPTSNQGIGPASMVASMWRSTPYTTHVAFLPGSIKMADKSLDYEWKTLEDFITFANIAFGQSLGLDITQFTEVSKEEFYTLPYDTSEWQSQ